MVQNPTYWRTKEFDKTLLGNVIVSKEKSHFSLFYFGVWHTVLRSVQPLLRILYHMTSSCKRPLTDYLTSSATYCVTRFLLFCMILAVMNYRKCMT